MYKYVAIDLDGTILGNNHNISEYSAKVLRKLQKENVKIFLCSGRNISQMNFVADKIEANLYDTYIVSDNGGVITELKSGIRNLIKNFEFEYADLLNLLELTKNTTRITSMFKDGKRYTLKFSLRESIRSFLLFKERTMVGIPDGASKLLLIDEVANIEKEYDLVKLKIEKLMPFINVFRSVPTLIEITPPGATKGAALEFIFASNNWNLDELIVFGDGENDISMFKIAGYSVAMENGFDTLKAVSDDICLKNSEDGVARYLVKLFNLEIS